MVKLTLAEQDFNAPLPLTPLPGIELSHQLAFENHDQFSFQEGLYYPLDSFWLSMDPDISLRDISSIYKSIVSNGYGSHDYLSNNQKWGLYVNHFQSFDPIRLSPLTSGVNRYAFWQLSWIPGTNQFPYQEGVMQLSTDHALSSRVHQLFTGYASDGNQYILTQSGFGTQDEGWYVQLFRDLNQGDRYNFGGNVSQGLVSYAKETPTDHIQVNMELASQIADFNYSIPTELAQVNSNQFYVAPSQDQDHIQKYQFVWQHSVNDRHYFTATSQYQTLDLHKNQAHPLDVKTCTSGGFDDGTLCLNNVALVDQDLNTIIPSSSSRTYGSLLNADEKHYMFDQTIQFQKFDLNQQWLFGMTGSFIRTDYDAQSQLATFNDKRYAQPLTNNGSQIEIDGVKSDSTADAVISSLTPVDLKSNSSILSLFTVYQSSIYDDVDAYFSTRFNGVLYDVSNESQLALTENDINAYHHFQRFNPSASIVYHYDQINDVFGSIYQYNQAPSLLALYCSDENEACYWPKAFFKNGSLDQTLTQGLRLGVRGETKLYHAGLGWAMTTHIEKHHDDIILVPTDWMKGYARNVDETRDYGVNLKLYLDMEKVHSSFAYRYLNATYQSTFTVPTVYDPNTSQNVLPGDAVPGVPRQMIRWNTLYQWNKDIALTSSIIGVGSSEYYGNFNSNHSQNTTKDLSGTYQLDTLPGYGLLNLGLTWRPNRHLQAFFTIDNVFNKAFYTDGSYGQAPDPATLPFTELGDTGSGDVQGIKDPQFVSPGQERIWRIAFKLAL
ncbi:MAG: hypothetical protein CBD38_02855 [bacterium TMED178]|nr:MAG: hypothetical protein CBD38_02855 [bacterium TMED178]